MNRSMVEGAARYAAANKSDPFAFNRAMTHVANGVAGYRWDENNERHDAFYDARRTTEKRKLPEGQRFSDGSDTYEVEVFNDVKVPA